MTVSLSDVLTTLKAIAAAINSMATETAHGFPTDSSQQLAANTLVQVGFVRVTGMAVVTAGVAGGLYDAATVAGAGSGQQVATVPATVGYTPMNMVFETGLVYKPGAGQVITLFYRRT